MEKKETRIMEVAQVLHMNGGIGETSYANNSLIQQKAISLTKDMREEAISRVYRRTVPRRVAIADLGCSCGPNTLIVISEVIKSVEKLCKELNHDSPEYQFFMNDLPGNDFNNIFRSLHSFKQKLSNETEAPCFFNGVPGSFYGRIFPTKSLHFVHSSYSLQWLSQVPEGVENNKGNIYMAMTSPLNVLNAYYKQFQRDFSLFLKSRAEELVEGGCMVLTFWGRRSDNRYCKECCHIWELLTLALNNMVSEGIIKEEEMNSFNIPLYTPSPCEVKLEVLKEGSFTINCLEVSEVHWNAYDDDSDRGHKVATKCMRAVVESLLVNHFGEAIIEDVFRRYQQILTDHRKSKDKTKISNVNISLTRKALT